MLTSERFLKLSLLIVGCAAWFSMSGQIIQVPLSRKPAQAGARVSEIAPLALPFWDDFSLVREKGFPNDTIWEISRRTWVNDGMGINPPSVQVATLDGLDSIGAPYSLTDLLAKGFADRLLSRRIRLGDVAEADRNSVYLSFYYQVKGRGEAPDPGDNLSLWMLDNLGAWTKVWEIANSVNLNPEQFYYQTIAISDPAFFHNNFRFRFQNFARLSGPYDAWHLDYIYLNKGRTSNDRSMPDRTISTRLSSPLGTYTSIPLTHYRDTFPSVSVNPSVKLFGLLAGNFQPFRYTSRITINQRVNGQPVKSSFLLEDDAVPVDPQSGAVLVIQPLQLLNLQLGKSFPGDSIRAAADSAAVEIRLGLNTADDSPLTYLPEFRPINFLWNDTTTHRFLLQDFYAYDDGEAEFGAGLNQPGTQLAYGFDALIRGRDTLIAVQIHFPPFGDQSNQTLSLKIWDETNGLPGRVLFQQPITVSRLSQNRFVTYTLAAAIPVSGRFFVGWQQNTSAVIPAGLDKNFDSGSAMFFNVNGSWEQNTLLYGSLMIRPVFGNSSADVITSNPAYEAKSYRPWPNPSDGTFRISSDAQQIEVLDITGRTVDAVAVPAGDVQEVRILHPSAGLFLVRYFAGGQLRVQRISIR